MKSYNTDIPMEQSTNPINGFLRGQKENHPFRFWSAVTYVVYTVASNLWLPFDFLLVLTAPLWWFWPAPFMFAFGALLETFEVFVAIMAGTLFLGFILALFVGSIMDQFLRGRVTKKHHVIPLAFLAWFIPLVLLGVGIAAFLQLGLGIVVIE